MAGFFGEHELGKLVGCRDGEPDDRQVSRSVGESAGWVAPVDLPELELPVGASLRELRLDARDEAASDRGLKPDPQDRACGCCRVSDELLRRVPASDQFPCRGQERLAGWGERDGSAVAGEQLDAELFFQEPYLLGQRGLGDEQSFGGAGEVQFLGHRDEVPQVSHMHIHNRRLLQEVLDTRAQGFQHGLMTTSDFNKSDLADRLAVTDATVRMLWHADRREWDRVRDVLADQVTLDYTSLNGGEPVTITSGQVIEAWSGLLGSFDATQHLASNHLVSIHDDTATCTASFQATHLLANSYGDPVWTLGGHYHFDLTRTGNGWRITSVTMTADWATGNQQIMNLAAQRAAAGPQS